MAVRFRASSSHAYVVGTSINRTIPASAQIGDLLIASVMHRDTLTPPAGWTFVDSAFCSNGTSNQYTSVYKRACQLGDPGAVTTWGQATSQRLSVNITALSGGGGIDVVSSAIDETSTTASRSSMPVAALSDSEPGIFLSAASHIITAVSAAIGFGAPSAGWKQLGPLSVAQNRMAVGITTTAGGAAAGSWSYDTTYAADVYASVTLLISDGDGYYQEADVTQAAILALYQPSPDLEVTQAAILALYQPSPDLEVTQAAILVLTEFYADLQVTQTAVLCLSGWVPCLTRWAQCWRIERRDGEVFRFTSHDQAVLFRGEEYQPCQSLAASASELGTVLGTPGDITLAGMIADAGISEGDLYAGLFDRAQIEVWMVPWEDAGGEIPFRLNAGVAGDLSQGDRGYAIEVLTPGGRLQQQPLLEVYTPACRWELGDARCGVDLAALAVTGAVTASAQRNATTRAHHRVLWDASRSEADGYFDLGTLYWTSGANAGQSSEIKSYSLTNGGQFVLWQPMQHPIALGDQYEARPGCDKAAETCKIKFSNYANYGGFPDVPGRDSISQTPNAKG